MAGKSCAWPSSTARRRPDFPGLTPRQHGYRPGRGFVSPERQLVGVLDADPELGERLDSESREVARRYAVAERVTLDPGPWGPHEAFPSGSGRLGLLVIGGLIK